MANLPPGTVTFLFTDFEGSTTRWMRDHLAMADALHRSLELVAQQVAQQVAQRGCTL